MCMRMRGGDRLTVRYQPQNLKNQGGITMSKSNLIQDIMGNYNLTLRRVCTAADLKYHRYNNAARKPIVGQVYDPEAINWDAVRQTVTKEDEKKLTKVDWNQVTTGTKTKVVVDYDKFTVGSRWHLRNFGWVTIVYVTATHVVIIIDGETEIPRSWKIETFIVNGPSEEERDSK